MTVDKRKKAVSKQKKSTSKTAAKDKLDMVSIPKSLMMIHFDDVDGWLKAYRSMPAQLVARAVIKAFRERYFLSQKAAADKTGLSPNTISKWEIGRHSLNWATKEALVRSGWFKPQHFGLDAPAADFGGADDE